MILATATFKKNNWYKTFVSKKLTKTKNNKNKNIILTVFLSKTFKKKNENKKYSASA